MFVPRYMFLNLFIQNLEDWKKKKIPYPEPMFHVPFDESFSVYPMTPFLIQNIYKPYCGSLTNDFEGHIHPQWWTVVCAYKQKDDLILIMAFFSFIYVNLNFSIAT